MRPEDIPGVVQLQHLAFPPPFSEDLLWDAAHLARHIEVFPAGQWVMQADGLVVGSCSNVILSEAQWQAHAGWEETVGGPFLERHDDQGTTLYGLDISVHPDFRKQGLGRRFYAARFDLVVSRPLLRYGTGCRLPDYRAYTAGHPNSPVSDYAARVVAGHAADRTLTPLLRYGLRFLGVIERYLPDEESGDAAALLEWTP